MARQPACRGLCPPPQSVARYNVMGTEIVTERPSPAAEPAGLEDIAGPLLDSPALERLRAVSFLGALAPRHRGIAGRSDGSRFDHSVGVAALAVRAAERLGLSRRATRYAAAWGLLHDVATWALSHTSEPAFRRITRTSPDELRARIVTGHFTIPAKLSAVPALEAMGVDPLTLLGLFDKATGPHDPELYSLWSLIRSPLTPDTLEGIWRAAQAYEVEAPDPREIIELLVPGLFEPAIAASDLRGVERFWTAKARVYRENINSPEAIRWESDWAAAILAAFAETELGESLELHDDDVLSRVPATLCERCAHDTRQTSFPWSDAFMRYKPPLEYVLAKRPDATNGILPVLELRCYLRSTRTKVHGDHD